MTLVISQSRPRLALQTTDRLVTRARKPVDPLANKNIVFLARDAVVSFGYTGQAFVKGVPTDTWVAETLIGKPAPDAATLGAGPNMDVGLAVSRLKQRMKTESVAIQVVGVGWKWKKNFVEPYVVRVLENGISIMPRWWWTKPQVLVDAVPGENFSFVGVKKLSELKDEDAQQGSVFALQEIAKTSDLVGADCISVSIPSPTAKLIEVNVRFIPASKPQSEAYTPWIVSRHCVCPPAKFTNIGWVIESFGNGTSFRVTLDGDFPSSGISGFSFGMQSRPKF